MRRVRTPDVIAGSPQDQPDHALAQLTTAETKAGVCLTPEWRAFFLALLDPDAPNPDPDGTE